GPDAPGSAVPESGWSAVVDRPGLYAALAREAGVDQSPPDLPDHGLPDHLAARIRQHPLRPPAAGAPVQLLAHQEVAARFFLAQRRMVLADEPGLDPVPGVVAALAHLDAVFDARPSRRRILLTTAPERLARWRRRVEAVGLDVFVLGASAAAQDSAASSGSEPPPVHDAVTGWAQHGGVLLASHEDLPVLDEHRGQLIGPAAVDTVVLDDAHHLTDDAALDAAARQWASAARRVLALTTAPIENPGSPGRAVLELVDGEGAGRAQELTGARWWIAVAPRVLHRTRAEVLDQVPTRVVTTHEVPFSPADAAAYRAAVDDGTFLRLRQAAFHPGDSAKLELLMRLVQEATLHGERVMVVSAFREVLDTVAAAITARGLRASPLLVLAPHTSMPRLADPAPPRVSVDRVILCEPRVGHAAEQRALATAQAPRWDHPLLVHRLVSTQGVDQELLRLSREQSAADASLALPPTPEQLSALAREIVARERARLALSAGPVGGDSRTGL
ncbi:MAG: hypothetical protein Q4G34_08585, partial [Micrococcus sp.]|nr:hypothetical protein [Micrococcus sp.]